MHTMHSSRMRNPVVLSRRYISCAQSAKSMRSHVLESTFISFTHSLLRFFILPHLVEDCRENPALLWNYLDESNIGMCAEMASAMHPKHLQVKLMERKRLDM